jgi:Tfp pilus assembly protein PilN
VQAAWQPWRAQQWQAWQMLQHLLSVPPRGVQIERILWREQYIQLSGWALSTGHWQAWLTRLALAGFSTPVDKAQWEESSWRNAQGLAAKQHRFSMQVSLSPQTTDKP